jgi:hypothetical protein
MPAGFQVFNSHGTTQIDENWRNYGYRGKIIYPITISSAGPFQADAVFTLAGEAVMIACRSTVFRPTPLNSNFDGTTWMFRWRFFPQFTATNYFENVEFYIFDVLPDGGFSNVGLEVFDAAGKRVFHSDMSPMRVPPGGILPATSGFTGEPGRIYAPLILRNPIFSELVGGIGRHSTYTLYSSGSSIIPDYRHIGSASLALYPTSGLYAAVDVTGQS